MHSTEDYLQVLLNLLPYGKAWFKEPDGVLYNLMYAFAEELTRVDTRVDDLLVERSPRYTNELIVDHETDLGLPDECYTATTLSDRQKQAFAKYISEGGLNEAEYIEFAENFGLTITIDQFKPFWCGIGVSGDPCGDQDNIFYWRVNIFGVELSTINLVNAFRCTLEKHKPAHTTIKWLYAGHAFSSAFSNAFDTVPGGYDPVHEGAFGRGFSSAFDVGYV